MRWTDSSIRCRLSLQLLPHSWRHLASYLVHDPVKGVENNEADRKEKSRDVINLLRSLAIDCSIFLFRSKLRSNIWHRFFDTLILEEIEMNGKTSASSSPWGNWPTSENRRLQLIKSQWHLILIYIRSFYDTMIRKWTGEDDCNKVGFAIPHIFRRFFRALLHNIL